MTSGRTGPATDSLYGWGGAPVQPTAPVFDAELGQIFIRMRTLLGLSLWDMARAVGSEPMVIADLEAGAVGGLPPWPEVTRLVGAYAHLAGIDPHPILTRMHLAQGPRGPAGPMAPDYHAGQQPYPGAHVHQPPPDFRQPNRAAIERIVTAQLIPRSATQPAAARPVAKRPSAAGLTRDAVLTRDGGPTLAQRVTRPFFSIVRGVARGLSYRARTLLFIALFAVVPAAVAIVARVAPGLLYAMIEPVPAAVRQPLRLGVDWTVGALAPVRDGLTWIDVDDPQIRKSARLPAHRPLPGR